ncbi:MAG: YraN family protein [Syntrophorhabdaceae bacterium]|nr:YraN family protein [Syntrophorhabdaceae bacterium]
MIDGKRKEGKEGEERAVKILKAEGYRILERNYTSPFGEIDIIAEEGGYIVFVEVKKRNSQRFGGPLHSINEIKKRHMIRSAQFYLKENRGSNKKARFDVVGIGSDGVKIVKNAFAVE